MLISRVKWIPAFVYEFQYTKDEHEDLEMLAEQALQQIEDKKYETKLTCPGISNVIKIGIAFCGKTAVVKR